MSQCLLVVGAGLDDELSNGRTRRRPRLSQTHRKEGTGGAYAQERHNQKCTSPKPKQDWLDMTLGSCSLKKRKMYVSCVAHFDTWLKHALAHCMLKTNPFPLLADAPLDPFSINRSNNKTKWPRQVRELILDSDSGIFDFWSFDKKNNG